MDGGKGQNKCNVIGQPETSSKRKLKSDILPPSVEELDILRSINQFSYQACILYTDSSPIKWPCQTISVAPLDSGVVDSAGSHPERLCRPSKARGCISAQCGSIGQPVSPNG